MFRELPLRVIVDSHLTLNPELRILRRGLCFLVCSRYDIVRAQVFEDMGVEVLELPGADGKVDLQALIKELLPGAKSMRFMLKQARN